MKVKVKSYEIKNTSAPGTKAKKLKIGNIKTHAKIKYIGGIKDNRKYINDSTLSEAEKLSRRMALENMKRKSSNISKNPNKLFSKNTHEDDTWDDDPFLLKAQQIGQFDEGIDESSSDDDDDKKKENTEKYFANNSFSQKKGRKTLEEVIRDSKMQRYGIKKANEENEEALIEANIKFRDEQRFILPKLGVLANAKSKSNKFQDDKVSYKDVLQKHVVTQIYAPKLAKADGKSIKEIPITEKENEKIAHLKIRKLREYLMKKGITNDDEAENFLEGAMSNSESDHSDDEEESLESTGEAEESEKESVEDDEELNEFVESDNSAVSEEIEESDNSVDSEEIDESSKKNANQEDAIKNLKKLIFHSNKSNKRKLEDSENTDNVEEPTAKKCRNLVESNKNEIDCFRALLKMTDLRRDALLTLANEMNANDIDEKNFSRRLILANVFQQALKSDSPNSYSPELIGFVRFFLENATENASTWLSLKTNAVNLEKSNLLNVCRIYEEIHKPDQCKLVVSSVFHLLQLLVSIINCNRHLTNKHSLFLPFGDILRTLPSGFYPSWLIDKVDEVISAIERIRAEAEPPMLRMKKVFQIVQLLEPKLEDKYDSKKDLTKSLKDKLKKEKKSTKKEMQLNVKHRILNEIAESKKQSQFRAKKTMEIINGISSR